MRKHKISKKKAKELPTWPVGYGRKNRIMVPYPENPREGICDSCRRSVHRNDIKTTNLHHWKYSHRIRTIKKDPLLVLENLSELCYSCHRNGDSLRVLLTPTKERLTSVVAVALLMPPDMKGKMDYFARSWIAARKRDKKTKISEYA